jgi:translation initiation factor 1
MGKGKNKKGIVYSTDPEYDYEYDEQQEDETLSPEKQNLIVSLDNKNRKGKAVTLVSGFIGTESDLKDLAKSLKQYCGTGGSAKDGEIIVQGDTRKKVSEYLNNKGYRNKVR